MRFQLGDTVRISGLQNSEWRGRRGIIVGLVELDRDGNIQECVVSFDNDGKSWFLGAHLVKSVPQKAVRFFRAEVLERWNYLDPDKVAMLNGDREELIAFLRDEYDFSTRRAEREADEFADAFSFKLKLALEGGGPHSSHRSDGNISNGKPDVAA